MPEMRTPVRQGTRRTAAIGIPASRHCRARTGAPELEGTNLPIGCSRTPRRFGFTLATPVPLGKWVTDVEVFAEVLPDARTVP